MQIHSVARALGNKYRSTKVTNENVHVCSMFFDDAVLLNRRDHELTIVHSLLLECECL